MNTAVATPALTTASGDAVGMIPRFVHALFQSIRRRDALYLKTSSGNGSDDHATNGSNPVQSQNTRIKSEHTYSVMMSDNPSTSCSHTQVRCSFLELHNEELKDLLDPISSSYSSSYQNFPQIHIREDPILGVVVSGVKEIAVTNPSALNNKFKICATIQNLNTL
jgi:hypothetical protein